jgi:hypothetical protein
VIYFIGQGTDGPIKIGYTRDLSIRKRLASLQTANPFELIVIGTRPGGPMDEDVLHTKLDRFRLRGEWFQRCEEVLRELSAPVEPIVFKQIGPSDEELVRHASQVNERALRSGVEAAKSALMADAEMARMAL